MINGLGFCLRGEILRIISYLARIQRLMFRMTSGAPVIQVGYGLLIGLTFMVTSVQAVEYSPLPESGAIGKHQKAAVPFDLANLKQLWKKRLDVIRSAGKLPIIDLESSFNAGKLNARKYAELMDENGIALTAFSAQIGNKKFKKEGKLWLDAARSAVAADPSRYIPASTAGIYPAFTKEPDAFVETTIKHVKKEHYPLMGEFEFRHYMSPNEYKRNATYRDVTVPIDSPAGQKLFAFSARSGISFQIHYEIEDKLLSPLEAMLAKYPKAKVVWCHLAQIRYANKAKHYTPEYVRKLIETYPNLYFDLAFGGYGSIYPASNERHAHVWEGNGRVKQAWIKLIVAHPYHFLAALDIGGDRMNEVGKKTRTLRSFIANLPKETQEIVAYKAAWKLLFNEQL